jgi:two-component system response regulator YesN
MKLRILIADDEQLERRALSTIIAGLDGHTIEIIEAANGRQAVEAATAGRINMALLDIRMPGLDGIAAARQLRMICPDIRIIFVTAFDHFDYAREAIRLGVDEYLVKPASPEEVRGTVLRIIQRITGNHNRDQRQQADQMDSGQALALLADELRADLDRDELDGRRLAAFLRLKEPRPRITLAIVIRPLGSSQQESNARRLQLRRIKDITENRLGMADWQLLCGTDEAELRCLALCPISGPEAEPIQTQLRSIQDILQQVAVQIHTILAVRIIIGACPAPPMDGAPLFTTARDAIALARQQRPVVVLLPPDAMNPPSGNLSNFDASSASSTSSASGASSASSIDRFGSSAVERAIAYMHAHLAEDLSLTDVAMAVGSAPSHLSRLFSRHAGDTFVHVFCRMRIDAARNLLHTGQYRIKEVCALVGFNDQAYFSRVFRKYEGTSPVEYRITSD